MRDEDKSREQLLRELADLRQQLASRQGEKGGEPVGEVPARPRAEEMLRAAIDNSATFVYLKDLAGRFLLVNRQFEAAFHQSEADLLGKTDFDVHATAEQAQAVRANDLRVIETGGPVEFEEVVQLGDGPHDFLSLKFPVRDSSGAIYATGGVSTDITERKRAEEELRQSEERFTAFMDNSPTLAWMKDEDGRYAYLSKSYQRALPEGPADRRGLTDFDLWPAELAREYRVNDLKVLDSGKSIQIVEETRGLDGEPRYWLDSKFPFRDASGKRYVGGIGLDVTEQKRAETERERLLTQVENERARLEAVLQQMPSGVAIIEAPSGATILTNEQLVSMWQQKSAFASVREFGQLVGISPDGRAYGPDDWPVVRSIRSGEIVTDEEIRFQRWDGSWGTQIISSAPIRDRAGNTVAAVAVVSEITERKAAEEERERLLAELEATVEAAAAGVVVYDRSGRIARMNAAAARIMGYSTADMALPMADLFARFRFESEDGRALRIDEFPPARALRGERVSSVAMALYRGDQKVWIYDGASPIRPQGGEIVGAVVSFVDITGQKRLEEALRESEERFRAMIDSIPQLAWMADADGFIFWYNRGWYEYTGTTPEEMAGWGWQSVHDPAVLPKVLERWQRSIATGEPFDMEYPLRGADGRFRWFLTRVSPLKNEQGRVVRWFGTNTDVDEKRESEAERERLLAEIEAQASDVAYERDRLRTVLESMADAVFVCDAAGVITQANDAASALLGVPSVDTRRNLADYLSALRLQYPDGRPVSLEELAITRALSGVTERGREEVGVDPTTGRRVDLLISAAPLRDADGRVVGAVEVAADITRMRELADVAQRRAAELQGVLDNMVDAVFVCTPAGRIVLSNPAAARMFGLPSFDAITSLPAEFPTLFHLRHPDGRPVAPDEMATARALAGQTVVDAEQVLRSPGLDQDRHVRVSASPIRDAEGRIAGAVVVARDVTALTELDRLKDQFLVVAAHELKTPVTIMKGYAQALARASFDLSPQARRMIEAIDHGADRIDRIVKDLLDITRLQAGHLELADERVDLDELAEAVVGRFALTASKHRPRVVQADPAVVRGDRSRIEEVLADLLDNAARYSPAGGDVDVAVRVEGDRAVVSVRDRGIGIPPEKQARIFERFYRAHTRTRYDYGGMGVGLYIAREVIARHGGQMWFESAEGQGSTFYFSLPLTREQE